MWIQLTKNNGEAILVSSARITHVSARQVGGSTIYLDSTTTDANGTAKARSFSVQEAFEQIQDMLRAGGSGAKGRGVKTS
ncbi:hypothetical protein [Mesorhizobium sp. CN2-181]|uniref:hypothetical protein n=1 Tax=Mesorhizobium yinganensis TaxID=3157707 RepID=UPI0032B7448D